MNKTDNSGYTKRARSEYNAYYWQNNKERLREQKAEAYKRFIDNNPDYQKNYYKKYREL